MKHTINAGATTSQYPLSAASSIAANDQQIAICRSLRFNTLNTDELRFIGSDLNVEAVAD